MKSFTLATLAADDDAIKESFTIEDTSTDHEVSYAFFPTRALTVTTSASEGSYFVGSVVVIEGTDSADAPLSEDFEITEVDGDEVIVGVELFKTVTSVTIPHQANILGSFQIGFQEDPADDDAIKAVIASDDSAASYDGLDLDGVIGALDMIPARLLTVNIAANAGSYVADSVITFTGTNENDEELIEEVTIVGTDGDEVLTTLASFKSVVSIDVEAQADTDGFFEFGVAVSDAVVDAILDVETEVSDVHEYSNVEPATDLDGIIGSDVMTPARTLTVTTTAATGAYVVDSVITIFGRDALGCLVIEEFVITDPDGGETLVGDVGFSEVTSISAEPQALESVEFKIGVRDYLFAEPPLGLRFGAVGDIKLGYSDGTTDIVATLIVGEHLPIRAERIYCTTDTTTSKVTLVF